MTQARCDDGTEGLIPENYVQVVESPMNGAAPDSSSGSASVPQSMEYDDSVPQSAGYESTAYSSSYDSGPQSAGYDSAPQSAGYEVQNSYDSGAPPEVHITQNGVDTRVSAYSESDYEVQKAMMEEHEIPNGRKVSIL